MLGHCLRRLPNFKSTLIFCVNLLPDSIIRPEAAFIDPSVSPEFPGHAAGVLPDSIIIVGDLKSIYEMKCALLDKIVNFGTQIVKIFLYRNFNGSKLVRPVFGRHLGFQNGRHMGPIFSNISKRKTFGELITS